MPRKTKEALEKSVAKANPKTKTSSKTKVNSKAVEKQTAKASTKVKSKTVEKPKAKSTSTASKKVPKTSKATNNIDIIEYYDLPYRYNKTIVKILAQTPKTLFVYWDISDDDRKRYISQYGENFFNDTIPILSVHNKTKNYSFELEINDFANSWYFNVNDEKCEYIVELARKARTNAISIPDNYLYITSSNTVESPNDHILFEKEQKIVYFRNVITNNKYSKDVATSNFLRYMGRIYNIYELYHKIYNDNEILDLKNPSSSNPTSRFL